MLPARVLEQPILPLLVWSELQEIDRLQQDRVALERRIQALRPHAHKRIELETRLRAVTLRQLELQTKVGDRR